LQGACSLFPLFPSARAKDLPLLFRKVKTPKLLSLSGGKQPEKAMKNRAKRRISGLYIEKRKSGQLNGEYCRILNKNRKKY
jgi:hypothetical protein